MNDMNENDAGLRCWSRRGDALVYQQCGACGRRWLFRRGFCPHCAAPSPTEHLAAGGGTVRASTLVHRAPSDEFRALAPYRLVLVDLDEGVRLMAHADPAVAIGDRVRGSVRRIAGRPLPFFDKDLAS
ncbi:OB-fold domain-containing protein [Aquincola sp. MAHUQ-54]|uniref:OB-fold domain-containing protein n=1 Tax=Aquincola agrisoli TaxID=3119538 RepID=A0AAW9PZL8_9BURK